MCMWKCLLAYSLSLYGTIPLLEHAGHPRVRLTKGFGLPPNLPPALWGTTENMTYKAHGDSKRVKSTSRGPKTWFVMFDHCEWSECPKRKSSLEFFILELLVLKTTVSNDESFA